MKRYLMKKYFLISIFLFLFIFSFSCSVFDDTYDEKVVSEVSDSIANNENGLIQELSDNTSLVNGGNTNMKNYLTDANLLEKEVDQKATVTLTYNNALSSGFSWNESEKCYERTIKNIDVNSENFAGTITTVTLKVWFFESTDAIGDAVQLNEPKNLANNTNIKSMKYTRHIEGSLTNNTNGNKRTYIIDSEVFVTEINDDLDGVHMIGTRQISKTVDAQYHDSTCTITEQFDCMAYRDLLEGSTYYTTYEGTAHIEAVGDIITSNGSTKHVERTTDITFNRTRYVTITVNGLTVTIDIVTGQQIQ